MPKGMLIVISGPSGAGKGTIIGALLKAMPELRFSVSATTRKPRKNEKEGTHYFFMSQGEFEKKIKKGEFLEWAKVHEDYYGTPKSFVEQELAKGDDLILDIDVQGGRQVKKKFPEGVFIFIVPPTFKELKSRLSLRHTENAESLARRLKDAKKELRQMKAYDYLVVNDILSQAVRNVEAIIRAERSKAQRRLKQIQHALSPH